MSGLAPEKESWPSLSYEKFKPTQHLLHRGFQMMGKLKLNTVFEPHWANVVLHLSSRGLTTGPIPLKEGVFSVSFDCLDHVFIFNSSFGKNSQFKLQDCSTAELFEKFLEHLHQIEVDLKINPKPQEIPNALSFLEDREIKQYNNELTKKWWQILASSYKVLAEYHAHFLGISPSVGFMWGTFDLRDARYLNRAADTQKLGFIERNAMDVHQVEAGFWPGNEIYPNPAYFSFTYPKPKGIETVKIKPDMAYWHPKLGEFILDYEEVRNSKEPEALLLQFFESAYEAGSKLANWDPKLISYKRPS